MISASVFARISSSVTPGASSSSVTPARSVLVDRRHAQIGDEKVDNARPGQRRGLILLMRSWRLEGRDGYWSSHHT